MPEAIETATQLWSDLLELRSEIAFSPDGEPPREFRLFKFGPNPTVKGTFYLTQEDAAQAVSNWQAMKRPLSGDWEHASVNPPKGKRIPASAWFRLSIKEGDGLWATSVDWTKKGYKDVKNKYVRFTSPAFATQKDEDGNRHIRFIHSFALTNDPATLDLAPLVAHRGGSHQEQDTMPDLTPQEGRILVLARTLTKKEDPSEVCGALQALANTATEVETLRKKIADLEAGEVKHLIAAAKAEGKVTQAEEEHLLSQGLKDPGWLRGYLSAKPRVLTLSKPGAPATIKEPAQPTAIPGAEDPTEIEGLSFEDLAPVERQQLYQRNPEAYTTLRNDWISRGRPVSAEDKE